MTTTVTVKTHDWPVEIKTLEYHEHETGSFFGKRIDRLAPHSERQVHLTQTTRLHLTELPLPDQTTN